MNGKPAGLSLVYYECPAMCTAVLNGMAKVFEEMRFTIGEDFHVITVSIDPGETPELAARKKAQYIKQLGKPEAAKGWHFLTGRQEAIETLANQVGFRYFYDEATGIYAHAGGIMLLTPDGKLSRYFLSLTYDPKDMRFGLVEALRGGIGNLVDQVKLLCYAYDPEKGTYGFYVIGALRLSGTLMLLAFAAFWTLSYLQGRRKSAKKVDSSPPRPQNTL